MRASEIRFESSFPSAFSNNFKIESVSTPWKFSDVAEWISVSPLSGTSSATVSLNVQENTNGEKRSAIFYLLSDAADWDYDCALMVSQGPALPTLSVSEKSLSFGGSESTQTIGVTANCSWTASCSSSWVSLVPDVTSGTLNISVLSNPQKNYRTATVYVTYGNSDKREYIDITQSPANISASSNTLVFDNAASKYQIDLESETDWTSEASHSWISVTPTSGKSGKTQVSIEVAPNTSINERKGYVSIKTGGNERMQIAIRQRGLYIEADQEVKLSSAEQTKKINIKSNTKWTVTSEPLWITIQNKSGENDGELLISVSENNSLTPRTGEIILGQQGLYLNCKIKVIQNGAIFAATKSLLEFTSLAGQQSFDIISSGTWESTQNVNWFKSTPSNGKGNATIVVTVEENNTTSDRIGNISYVYASNKQNVTVHQTARFLNVDSRLFEFDSKGGNHTINLSTDTEWSAETEENISWLKISQSTGNKDSKITLSAEDNPSVNPRSASVVIKNKYAQGVRILVTQKARRLAISAQNILFFANGGTSDIISIDTDGKYDISSDASWFSITKGAGDTFTVVSQKNPTKILGKE